MKLTKTFIDQLEYTGRGKSAQYHWDERIPGFGIRVLPSNTKVFVLFYRYAGRQRWQSLGRHGAITLHQALKLANERYLELKGGKDPRAEATRLEFAGKTVADLCDYYLEHHATLKKKSVRHDRSNVTNWVKPHLGKLLVRDLKRAEVARLHAKIGKDHPVQANRVRSLISKMFNEAKIWGFVDENAVNPTTGVKPFKEVSRDRFLSAREELPRIAKEINKKDPFVRALIWLYLLTGLRKEELLRLEWKDVDLEEQRIRIGVTKSGKPHYLPLSAHGWLLLSELPRINKNPYVFPGRKAGTHRREFRRPWDDILAKAEIEDFRIHDLRRTVGTYLAQQGHSLALIGRVLNHANPRTTQIYARFAEEPIKKALEDQAKLLEGVIDVTPQT